MGDIEVEPGVHIYAQDVGEGTPVVLVAGFGLSHEVWDGQVRVLSDRHRVICVDLRGTGRSSKPIGGYRMDQLARDVNHVLAALELSDVTVVGWSFGGQVALQLASEAPDRLRRIILVCSNGVRASRSDAFPFGPDADTLEPVLIRGEERSRLVTRRKAIVSGFRAEPDPLLVDWLLRCQLQMPSWSAVACYKTYLRADVTGAASNITLPVGQLMGADDPVTTIEGAAWLQSRLHDGRLVTFDDCGHYPMFEARDRFDAELVAMVEGW